MMARIKRCISNRKSSEKRIDANFNKKEMGANFQNFFLNVLLGKSITSPKFIILEKILEKKIVFTL
jgi:hypothetical protein